MRSAPPGRADQWAARSCIGEKIASISHTAIETLIKGRKGPLSAPAIAMTIPCMQARQGYLAGLLLPWKAYRCPIMDTAGMTSMENRRHFLLVFRLGMNFPRDEGTTETKTANAKKEQHLFFFLFVSFDTAAAFFCQKRRCSVFQKVDKQAGFLADMHFAFQATLRNRRYRHAYDLV